MSKELLTTASSTPFEAIKKKPGLTGVLLDSINALVIVLDPTGLIIHFNRSCEELTGYSRKEVVGEMIWDKLVAPDSVAKTQDILIKAIAYQEKIPNYQNFWLTKEEKEYLISWRHATCLNSQGEIGCFVATGTIVEESFPQHKQAEIYERIAFLVKTNQKIQEELKESQRSERKYKALFAHTFQSIALVSPQGILLDANQVALNFGGLKLEDIQGRPLWEARWWHKSSVTQEKLKEAIAAASGGEFFRHEVDILGRENQLVTIDFSLKPIFDTAGKVVVIIAEGRDISKLKRAEEALQQLNQELDIRVRQRTLLLRRIIENLTTEVEQRRFAEAQQQRLISILEASIDCISLANSEGQLLWSNSQGRKVLGIPPNAELSGFTIMSCHPQRVVKTITEFGIPTAIRNGVWVGETVLQNSKGEEIPISHMIIAHKNDRDDVEYFSTVIRDLSQQKQVETDLAASYNLLQTIIDSTSDAVFVKDVQGRYQFINKAGAQIFNRTIAEVVGEDNAALLTPEVSSGVQAREQKIINSGISEEVEEVLTIEGQTQVFLTSKNVYRDHQGHVLGLVGLAKNITSLKQAQEDLEEKVKVRTEALEAQIQKRQKVEASLHSEHAKVAAILRSIPDALIFTNSDRQIIEINPAFTKLFGYQPEEVIGQGTSMLYTHQQDYQEQGRKRYHLDSKELLPCSEITYSRKDGSTFLCETLGSKVKDEFGKPLGFLRIVRDITVRKRAEIEQIKYRQQLQEINQELLNSNKELEQFAYVASHDLREPLRKIRSYVELLRDKYEGRLDEKADKYIASLVKGTTRMQNLISDLLTYSRVHRAELLLEPTDLGIILEQVMDDLAVAIADSSAQIIADPLPTVLVHPGQITQLLQNLVANAIKFQRDENPVIKIKVHKGKNEWLIAVADNGVGIKSRYTEQVFEIFQRLHSRSKYEGTGIGLAICKKIVERHNGRIWLESEVGQGTTFYFTLPMRAINS